jgi:hypothetical protein
VNSQLSSIQTIRIIIQVAKMSNKIYSFSEVIQKHMCDAFTRMFAQPSLVVVPIILMQVSLQQRLAEFLIGLRQMSLKSSINPSPTKVLTQELWQQHVILPLCLVCVRIFLMRLAYSRNRQTPLSHILKTMENSLHFSAHLTKQWFCIILLNNGTTTYLTTSPFILLMAF